jgi:Zinc finger, C3HC4 type (RING finger)
VHCYCYVLQYTLHYSHNNAVLLRIHTRAVLHCDADDTASSPPGSSSSKTNTNNSSNNEDAECDECSVCRDPAELPVVSECGHTFCRVCIEDLVASAMDGVAMECPDCSAPLTVDLTAAAAANGKCSTLPTVLTAIIDAVAL